MKSISKLKILLIAVISTVMAITFSACSPGKRHDFLTFFFDGVPETNASSNQKTQTALSEGDMVVNHILSKPEFFTHKPYEEEKCSSCHESEFSNRLIKPMPELCYSCHADFKNEFTVLHGPVSSGNCLECHNQHMAKYEKLLERTGQAICLKCHNQEQVLKSNKHSNIGDRNCTECHSPHGGDNSGMLKQGTCTECHESFKDKYKYLHGPAGAQSCTACHGSHSNGTNFILARQGQQLCLYCHNKDQVFEDPAHKKIEQTNCTECHNPHGESNKYFLKPEKIGKINFNDSTFKMMTYKPNMSKYIQNRNTRK